MSGLRSARVLLRSTAVLPALALLAGCGGGGVNSTPAPTPTPTAPAPTPPPTPTPSGPASYVAPPLPTDTIGYDDAEFRRSDGPRFHGAPTAWVAGSTGQGTVIGIVDSGIQLGNSELAGRISPDSHDMFSARNTVEAESDHGTFVALTAAAANNGIGTVGIAYGATVLAIRTDDPGTCATDDGCNFTQIAGAIDYAIAHNATVINLSLGGDPATNAEISAIRRASTAGIVVVISAGNDGGASPDPFPASLANLGLRNVIIAGSVDSNGVISSFSNRALSREAFYLAARGEDVRSYLDGSFWSISGTSFSAPQISGAVALLKQAFPNLTAGDIVDLLFATAQDVGAAGDDAIYGNGILDIRRAFQPVGSTGLAGSGTAALPLGDTSAVGSPAMGDALQGVSLNALVLDKYSRAFSTDIGVTMRGATVSRPLYDAVGTRTRSVATARGDLATAYTIDNQRSQFGADPKASPMSLSLQDAEVSRVLAARVALKLAPATSFGFAYAESASGLVMQLQGQDRPAFMVARMAGSDDGTFLRSDMSFALRRQVGPWGLTLAGTRGGALSANRLWLAEQMYGGRTEDAVRHFGVTTDRDWGALEATLGLDWMSEERTVLSGRFHEAFGGGGAQTLFVDASASWEFAPGFRLAGALRNGWTFPDGSSVIEGSSLIQSRAWSLDLERRGVFGGDSLALRLSQPLRVESGGLDLNLPVSWSYDTMSAGYGTIPLSLAPDGRELMAELAWRGSLWGGGASASLYFRRDPGHYQALPDDKGVALRWRKEF